MNIKLMDAIAFPSDLGEASLKIIGVTAEDDGIYTCIAANDMGSVSSSASLRVLGRFVSLRFYLITFKVSGSRSIGQRKSQLLSICLLKEYYNKPFHLSYITCFSGNRCTSRMQLMRGSYRQDAYIVLSTFIYLVCQYWFKHTIIKSFYHLHS